MIGEARAQLRKRGRGDRWGEGAGLVGEDAIVGAGVASQRILQVGKG